MSKFKLAIKLLYGRCQTITTLGGGFPITIMYVKSAILMMNISKPTSSSVLVIQQLSCKRRVYYQERPSITIDWATFAISSHKEPSIFLCVSLLPHNCKEPSTTLMNKFNNDSRCVQRVRRVIDVLSLTCLTVVV